MIYESFRVKSTSSADFFAKNWAKPGILLYVCTKVEQLIFRKSNVIFIATLYYSNNNYGGNN